MEQKTLSGIVSVEGDIVCCRIFADVEQSLAMAQENLQAIARTSQGRKRPLLLDLRKALPVSPDVRQYYLDHEVSGASSVIGMLVEESPFGQALGSTFKSLSKQAVPKRVFTNEEECRNWLQTFVSP